MSKWMLRMSLGLAALPAQAAWTTARTNHFIVYSDDAPAKVRSLATRLERFDKGLRMLHNLPEQESDRANPLTVYVMPDVSAVQRLCKGLDGEKKACVNVAGFYDGRAGGSVAFMPRRAGTGGKFDMSSQVVLFHEYVHHIMMANYAAAYPAWFIEGFAEFNSTANFDKDGIVGFGLPALHRFYGLVLGVPLPITTLLTANGTSLPAEQREQLYARGWLLTHYLTFEPSRKGQLEDYLKALNAGKPNLAAAQAAFGDLKTLSRDLDVYLKRPRLAYFPVKVDEVRDDAVALRNLTPGEAAMMPVRLRSDRGVDRTSAPLVVAEARRLAAPFAADPGAQTILAEAEYDFGDDDRAEAAADRALAADPSWRDAMIYKARARLRRAETARTSDPKVWQAARNWLIRANRAEPDDALPLYLYYLSYGDQGIAPTPISIAGLERAFALAPQDDGLRFTLARQYLRDHKSRDARAVLVPLAFDPHADPANAAAALIAQIDKGDDKAASAAIDATTKDKTP